MFFSIFKQIKKRYRQLYRFVIMDDATFEEKVVFRLTPRLFAVIFTSLIILLIILTISLVAFTPLREYIPGYDSEQNDKKIMQLQAKTDSLDKLLTSITAYGLDVKTILTEGYFKSDTIDLKQKADAPMKKSEFAFSEYDSILMQVNVAQSISKNIPARIKQQANKPPDLFYVPAKGTINQQYTHESKGIKISTSKESSVFASLAGMVIYVGYGFDKGTTLVLYHPDNILTVYQQAGKSTVRVGDYVKPKQVISIIDSDLPLEFALWINGNFVNPQEYILF